MQPMSWKNSVMLADAVCVCVCVVVVLVVSGGGERDHD